MHEESLNRVILDYLSGEELEETSYEEFRQALARLLVAERGYPKDRLAAKLGICFQVDDREYTRMADLLAKDEDGKPLMLVIFCSGEIGSYARESLAAARLLAPQPAPLTLVTDTKDALLLATADGQPLERGMAAIPRYPELLRLAAQHPVKLLDEPRAQAERRILYAYSEFLSGGCCQGACRPKPRG